MAEPTPDQPMPPIGGMPPKPAEAAKVQPKKETVRIALPPKPTAAPTIKLPSLPPTGAAPGAAPRPAAAPIAATQQIPSPAAAAPVAAAPAAAAPAAPAKAPGTSVA